MNIPPIIDKTSFAGYSSPLKTLYKRGQLPQVKYDFYGSKLTKDNASLEHLKCVSKGGKTNLNNLVLATKKNNTMRGNKPLRSVIDFEAAFRYLKQFLDVKISDFDGNEYVRKVLKTIGGQM